VFAKAIEVIKWKQEEQEQRQRREEISLPVQLERPKRIKLEDPYADFTSKLSEEEIQAGFHSLMKLISCQLLGNVALLYLFLSFLESFLV
jgi:hypothetical protein